MNYKDQLAIDFMAKLASSAAQFQERFNAKYNEFWIDAMNQVFDMTHEEIYGYLPNGC